MKILKALFIASTLAVELTAGQGKTDNKGSNGEAQANITKWDGNTDFYSYESGAFTFKKDIDKLTISFFQPATKAGQIDSWGWYMENANGNLVKTAFGEKLKGNQSFSVEGLRKGDTIGFYLEHSGQIAYSKDIDNDGEDLFHCIKKGDKEAWAYYTFGAPQDWCNGGVLAFTATPEVFDEPASDGQPLPAVWATVAVGGGIFAFLKNRKHKKNEEPL